MTNVIKYVLCVVIGILLAIVGYLSYTNLSYQKKEKMYLAKIDDLLHPLADTTIRHDSIVYKDSIVYRPYPVRTEKIDTVFLPPRGTVSYYDSTFKKNDIKFRWRAKVLGKIDKMYFSDFVVPKDIVEIVKWNDTCYMKPPEYKPKNHWGLYTELVVNNFKEFPGVGVGLQSSIKDKFTVAAGAMYMNTTMYGNLRIGVILK